MLIVNRIVGLMCKDKYQHSSVLSLFMLFLASSLFLIDWRVGMPSRRHCLGVFDHFLDLCLDCLGAYYMSIPKMNRSRRFT